MAQAKRIEIPRVKRYTRADLETALALVSEVMAHSKTILRDDPGCDGRSLTLADVDNAAALAACARIVHSRAENLCNGYSDGRGGYSTEREEADTRRADRAAAKARAILAQEYGDLGITLSTGGDPRGACFYLQFPLTQRHNTWGGAETGWAVS